MYWSAQVPQGPFVVCELPALSDIRLSVVHAVRNLKSEGTEGLANLQELEISFEMVRLCLREIDGVKVSYSDLMGSGLEKRLTFKQITFISRYLSEQMAPKKEEVKPFLDSVTIHESMPNTSKNLSTASVTND